MKICVNCWNVEVKGQWKEPTIQEQLLVQRGPIQETVCPECSEETFTKGGENALQVQM